MSKLFFCCLIFLTLGQLALADSINSFSPMPLMGNFGVYSQCPPAVCDFDFLPGTAATGSADFTSIGTPVTFEFATDKPLSWVLQGTNYYAVFGYGGTFQMTGPDGLTFAGVVTSGTAVAGGMSSQADVNFFGLWSNGQYADGTADVWQPGGGGLWVSLDEEIAPEPSSIVLLGTGFLGLWGWGRKLMR